MNISGSEVTTIVGALITGLTAAIGVLWLEVKSSNKKIREDYQELKEDHKSCNANITNLHGQIERISGEQKGIEKMSYAVLKEVRRLKEGGNDYL